MKLLTWIIVLFVISFIVYNIWSHTGKDYSSLPQIRDPAIEVINQGSDRGKGNMIGFQPYFTPVDYCDEEHFRAVLHPFFLKAKSEGLLLPRTIVVLPENTGTWLALSN